MLLQPIFEDLNTLKLSGMLDSLKLMQSNGSLSGSSFIDGLGLLLTQEKIYRENKRQTRLLKGAKLRFNQACVEDIDYDYPRALDKTKMKLLFECEWINACQNVVFIGATGLGKSYLACALGQLACRRNYSTCYFRVSKLLEYFRIAKADGSYNKALMKLSKYAVLILDDWGLEPLNSEQRHQLLELIEDRHQLHPMMITTQLPIELWHDYIGDNTVADAIVDRLTAKNSHIFTLKGDSMRHASQSKTG